MTDTKAILDFAAADHTLPVSARADTLRLLADTLAGGAAGANSPEAQALLPAVRSWGAGDDARVIGGAETLPAASAAYFNGFAIHCLEWDAVHEPAVVHALSTVTAAVLASADRCGDVSEEDVVTALALGVDIASGIGLSARGPMRFFRPATAGIIGAALAAARLEGLSREQMADILGLAYSQAAGTMQAHVEASIALPLQIANAAQGAIHAVDLARAGMNGPHDALDGPFGYSALIEEIDLSRYTRDLGSTWRISEISIKPFPSGRASHGVLGALSGLIEQRRFDPQSVASITVHAPPLIHRLVGRPYKPGMTPAYARLCLPFLVPLMLRDAMIDPRHFTASGMADEKIAALAGNVAVVLDDNSDGNALTPQRLIITMHNGEVLEEQIDVNLGSPDAPMNAAVANSKYGTCAALAAPNCDPRIFDNPLSYVMEKI